MNFTSSSEPTGIPRTAVSGLVLCCLLALGQTVHAQDAGVDEPASPVLPPEEKPVDTLPPITTSDPAPCPTCPPKQTPEEVRFSGTEALAVEYVGDNDDTNEFTYGDDDNFWVFRNVLELQANSRPFDGSVRLDATFFNHPPGSVDPAAFAWSADASGYTLLNYRNDFRVERVSGTVKYRNLKVTGGDFYVTFGRGTLLALAKFDDLALDNSLRGGRVDYAVPGKFRAIGVAGVVNAVNFDAFTHQILEDDPMDQIAGLRLELDAVKGLSIGASGVMMRPRFNDESQINEYRIYTDQSPGIRLAGGGIDVDMHIGDFSWYVEGSGQVHDNYRPAAGVDDVESENGWAAFSEMAVELPVITLKGQGYLYSKWLVEGPLRGSSNDSVASPALMYSRRVTLEPTWAPLKSLGNSSGGKLIGDMYFDKTKTQLVAAGAFIHYFGGLYPQGVWGKFEDVNVVHPTLALRQEIGDKGLRVSLEGGYFMEFAAPAEGEDGDLWHVMADANIPLTGRHSLKARAELRHHNLDSEPGDAYWVSMNILGYDWAGTLGIDLIHEYSDQTAGMDGELWGHDFFMPKKHYLQLRAEYFYPGVLRGLSMELRAGSQRGGRKCTGGGCRELPDAMGVLLNTVYRF